MILRRDGLMTSVNILRLYLPNYCVIKDSVLNRYVFYNTIKGEVIEDINQDGDIISCTDFKFNLADEKYLWLKELVFESDDSTNIDNNEQ